MKQLCTSGRWNIIFDENFTAAKKMKAAVRDEHFWKKGKDPKNGKAQDPKKMADKEKAKEQRIKHIIGKVREGKTQSFSMTLG